MSSSKRACRFCGFDPTEEIGSLTTTEAAPRDANRRGHGNRSVVLMQGENTSHQKFKMRGRRLAIPPEGGSLSNPGHLEPIYKPHHVREHKRATVALTDEQRAEIRELGRNPDLTQQAIADRFGIPRPTVNKILNGYSWFDGERVYPDVDCRGCGEKFALTDRRQRYCPTCKPRRRAA